MIFSSLFSSIQEIPGGINRLLAVIFFLWFAVIVRVIKDISQRTKNIWLQFFSVLVVIVFTPLLGLPLYRSIRPPRSLVDTLPRREALSLNVTECHHCAMDNDARFDYCVFCGDQLKVVCKECKTSYPASYDYCFKCGAPNL